jgi:methyltransferase (TIGR00027 family)
MALFRALESLRSRDSRLFLDPHAALFLTGVRLWLYRMARLPLSRQVAEWLIDRESPGARAAGIVRTKWIDDEAAAALEAATQLVLLGAGFDMRGLRLVPARHVTVFELDHPQTSLSKQAILRSAQRRPPECIRRVSIDFNHQSITEVLLQAGFDASQPACWIWEGVTNYLAPESVDSTLRQISETAVEGSTLLFTYVERAVVNHPERYFGGPKLFARLQACGEPWIFGLDPAEVKSYLAERGFELLKDVDVAEVWPRTGRTGSGTHGYEFYRLASARVKA